MTDHLVVAKFRPRTPNEPPRFTRAGTTQELLSELQAMLPADTAYAMVPDPDGKGFSFREAFRIVLSVTPAGTMQPETGYPAQYEPPPPPIPTVNGEWSGKDLLHREGPQDARQRVQPPTPTLPMAQPVKFDGFQFDPPKSQAQALAELGIQEPRLNLMPRKAVIPTVVKAKGKGKKHQVIQDPNDRDDPSVPDDALPITRSSNLRRKPTRATAK